jgi:hypothetical protein
MKALFLSHENLLRPGGGGNQICTREYHDVLTDAGFHLTDVTHQTDRAVHVRLGRLLRPSSYPQLIPDMFWADLAKVLEKERPSWVFCNFSNFLPVAARLREMVPVDAKLVLLSHGLASVDDAHRARIAALPFAKAHLKPLANGRLGVALQTEMQGLPCFDHVFCLAPFEVEICRWLGARSVSWWPRTLERNRMLTWRPSGGRVGVIGTLDHPPNLEGIFLFCAALQELGGGGPRVRIISRSAPVGRDLAAKYSFVDYLGPLEDQQAVTNEVATWSAFAHPIFCHAMGCSTKVATGLSWGLPLLTSRAGLRGYQENRIPVYDTPAEMAVRAAELMIPDAAAHARQLTLEVLGSAPDVREIGRRFCVDLSLDLGRRHATLGNAAVD